MHKIINYHLQSHIFNHKIEKLKWEIIGGK